MTLWLIAGFIAAVLVVALTAVVLWMRRAGLTPQEAAAELKAIGFDLARLPGRLRGIAGDPRTPKRARWMLIGLAIYVASPIDLIPDFLPGIGHLDELILVPLVLRKIKRTVPPDVWSAYFPATESGRPAPVKGHTQ